MSFDFTFNNPNSHRLLLLFLYDTELVFLPHVLAKQYGFQTPQSPVLQRHLNLISHQIKPRETPSDQSCNN